MPSYVLPCVQVWQEFAEQPVALEVPLRSCIVGEQFDLHRYTEPDEKAGCKVSNVYDPFDEACYPWPSRAPGNVVDETYTRVFFDDALLQYFNDPIGGGSIINWVPPGKNRIRADSLIWQTANGFSRETALLRDVKIGDVIKIVGNACGSPITFWSQVLGLLADMLASAIDPATSDISNQTATGAAAAGSQVAGATNNVAVGAVDGALYDGLPDGNPTEVYDVEVIGGGGQNEAILRVSSQSGNDDVGLLLFNVPFGSPILIGTRGLAVTFDLTSSSSGDPDLQNVFIVGQTFRFTVSQAFTPPIPSATGTYVGASDTSYIVTVSRGGTFAGAAKPQILVTTTTGVDISGPTDVSASGSAVPAGTQGVLIDFTGAALCKNDRYIVPVIASRPGPVRTLILANNLPDGLRGACSSSSHPGPVAPDLDVTLYIKKNMEVPQYGAPGVYNWIQSATEICIEAGIVGYDPEWVLGGVLQPLPVETAKIYVQHRDRVPTNCNVVGTISDIGLVPAILGKVHPDNPLAFGVFKSLENANGEEAKYLGVCSHSPVTLDDWLAALERLTGRDDVYTLVPLTYDKNVHDAFVAHCDANSTPEVGRWRRTMVCRQAIELIGVYTESIHGGPVLATITDDPDTSGTQYTIVEAIGEKFITRGVLPNDTVRAFYTTDGFGHYTYTEFVVDAVLNEETIRLASGPSVPVNVPSKIEIWHTQSKQEIANALALIPGEYRDRRVDVVWPDVVGNGGLTFPGYFLCCSLAGLRSGVLPHQGLTNVEILGYDDLSRTTEFFSDTQLNTMAASGYWIVTQDPNDGTVYTRHQLTTGDQAVVAMREQSMNTNFDHISYTFLNTLKPLIGRGNVTPTMIDIINGEINGVISTYQHTIVSDRLGPQIIDGKVLELRQHPTFKDRVLARVSLEIPAPLNNIELHLVV